jgi:hypothetical protein
MTVTGTTTMAVWNKVVSVDGDISQDSTGKRLSILPAGGGKFFLAGWYCVTATTTIPSMFGLRARELPLF